MRPVEEWNREKKAPAWLAAMVLTEAPRGREMDEAEYDALCAKMSGLRIGQEEPHG